MKSMKILRLWKIYWNICIWRYKLSRSGNTKFWRMNWSKSLRRRRKKCKNKTKRFLTHFFSTLEPSQSENFTQKLEKIWLGWLQTYWIGFGFRDLSNTGFSRWKKNWNKKKLNIVKENKLEFTENQDEHRIFFWKF